MTHGWRIGITLSVFALAIGLVLRKPKGWHEAWWTCLGAGVLIALRIVAPNEAVAAVRTGQVALVFLLALLLLTALVEQSGFFDWAAIQSARLARGNGHALFRNVFVLGAIVTAVLSLDTTAVMLTPLVLAFVQRLKLPAKPFVFACAFISNVGSLLLPSSNLTNLIYADVYHLSFGAYAARMILPQVVTLVLLYAALRLWFHRDLPERFDAAALGDPSAVIRHRMYFRITCVVLALVFVGYFIGPLIGVPVAIVTFAAVGVLAAAGIGLRAIGMGWLREVPIGLFPFVGGLFVLVSGVRSLGLTTSSETWFAHLGAGSWKGLFAAMIAAAIASNAINNLPAALLVRGSLLKVGAALPAAYGALLGTNIGPNITVFGSLATMLVLTSARRKGVDVTAGEFLRVGIVITPILLVAAALALGLTFALFPA
jgi:arsenical pump membrane protein